MLDMNDNPYRPPAARVSDIEPPQSSTRPPLVNVALGLFFGSFVVGFAGGADELKAVIALGPAALVGLAIPIALLSLLALKIWQGRNWARILLLVLMVLGLPVYVPQIPAMFELGALPAGIFIIQTLAQFGVLYIVFLTPARSWFSRTKTVE